MQLRNKPASSKSWHNIQQPIKRWPPTNLTRCCSPTCSAPVKCVASSSQRNIAIVVSSDDNKAIPEPCCRGASLQEPTLPIYSARDYRYPNIFNPAPLYMEACCFPHHPSLNVPNIFDPPTKLKPNPASYLSSKKPLEIFPEDHNVRTPSYMFTGRKTGCNCFSACHDSCFCDSPSLSGRANSTSSPPCEPCPDASNRIYPISTSYDYNSSPLEKSYPPNPNSYPLHRPDATNNPTTRDNCSTSSRFCPNNYGSCSTSSKLCQKPFTNSHPSACGSSSPREPSTLCVPTVCELDVRSCRDACPSTDSLRSSFYPHLPPPSNLFATRPSFASTIDNTAIEVCNSPVSPRIKNLPAWINPCLAYCDPKCKANSPCVQCICIPCNCIVCDCSRCQICDVECKPCHPRHYSDESSDPREVRAARRDEATGPDVSQDEACGPCRPAAPVDESCGTSPSERRDEACGAAPEVERRRSYCSQTATEAEGLPDFGERFKSIAAPCLPGDSSESSRKIVLWDVSCDDDKPSYRESEMIRLRYSNFYNNYNVDEMALRRERDSVRMGMREYKAPEPYRYIEVLNNEDPFYPTDESPPGYRKALLKIPCQESEKPIEMTIFMKTKRRSATFQRAYYPTCYILPVFEPTD